MPEFEITLSFEAYCDGCGGGMCGNVQTRKSHRRSLDQITIEPCEKCLENARNDAADKREEDVRSELEKEIENLKEQLQEAQDHNVSR